MEVLVIGAPVRQAVNQCRVGMEGENDRPVQCEKGIEIRITQSVRVLRRCLQFHQVDDIHHANSKIRPVLAQDRHRGCDDCRLAVLHAEHHSMARASLEPEVCLGFQPAGQEVAGGCGGRYSNLYWLRWRGGAAENLDRLNSDSQLSAVLDWAAGVQRGLNPRLVTEAGPLDDLLGHSITYRIAVGPRAGQKLFTLQTVPARLRGLEGNGNGAATRGAFSLHAGIDTASGQRAKLERLAMTSSGQVRYQLKTPYRDGTTHIVLEPLDLMARLAALVPPPRMHLTRCHGVFTPHSRCARS